MKRFLAVLRYLLIALCLCGICYSGWQLWQIYHTYQEGKELYAELTSKVVTETDVSTPSEAQKDQTLPFDEGAEQDEEPGVADIGISVDFSALEEINPDIVGWIYGPDTGISYPVVQGSDNEYYLHHLLDGSYNKNGTVFVDAQNSPGFADQNTILYGHHMKNGTMFAALEQYREQEYYQQHPVFYLLTPEGNYQLDIFSACVISANDEVYQTQFAEDEDFRLWVSRQTARSDVKNTVSVGAEDRVVTLSTCAYDFEDARYVVLARLTSLS